MSLPFNTLANHQQESLTRIETTVAKLAIERKIQQKKKTQMQLYKKWFAELNIGRKFSGIGGKVAVEVFERYYIV